jgi:hypothetical protein
MSADSLFAEVEAAEAAENKPWGKVLDAGTGDHSLDWICALGDKVTEWVAITGDEARGAGMRTRYATRMREQDRILAGNWKDPELLKGEKYDVVLADYLIGAIEGFAPYYQEQTFERLKQHITDDGRLYVIGLEPIPPSASASADDGLKFLVELSRCRDACILLAGHQCYREFPHTWIQRQLEQNGFEIVKTTVLTNVYGLANIDRQLNVCRSKLQHFKDQALAKSMETYINDIRERAAKSLASCGGKFRVGGDHCIVARLAKGTSGDASTAAAPPDAPHSHSEL